MSSTMMMERTGIGGMGMPGMSTAPVGAPASMPASTSFMMVPRCGVKFEKCAGGMKITCTCDDKMSCSMVQNLCAMLSNGMVSCCCLMNGMVVCTCNLTMGMCKCETTDSGVCITCTSGDSQCCEMIQACCDCLCRMTEAGCTCCVMMNNTPVCCCVCETSKTTTGKAKASR